MQKLHVNDLHIVLVEPSTMQSKLIASKLKEGGVASVECCDSIKAALERLESYVPDLICSAMYFPDGTGIDFLATLKQDERLEQVPFMLISSEQKLEYLDPIKQAGVMAILPKPFDADDLRRGLISTLGYLEKEDTELTNYDINEVRILVVDDSSLARKHIMRVLANLGATQLEEAADGAEAIEKLTKSTFDLVVTDYNMPKLDGGELLKFIRNESDQSHLPVIMVTSEQNQATLCSVRQEGVSALCDKPFDTQYVRGLLQQLL